MKLHIVPARTGLQWVKLGIRTFLRQPLALAGLFFLYTAVVLLLAQVPMVGAPIAALLVPASMLGLMAATEEASNGRFPMPTVLVSAFRAGRQRARAMLVLGAVYTITSLTIGMLATLVFGTPSPAPATPPAPGAPPTVDPRAFLAAALQSPIALVFWQAAGLVHWHGLAPAKSLFFSAVACLRNARAFIVYALAWMVVFLAAGLGLSVVGAMGGMNLAVAVLMPTLLIMAAMFFCSMYFTFRDCFIADPPEPTDPEPNPNTGGDPP